jgi:hypothetical protein
MLECTTTSESSPDLDAMFACIGPLTGLSEACASAVGFTMTAE